MGAGRFVGPLMVGAALLGAGGPGLAQGGQALTLLAMGPDGRPAPGVVVYLPQVDAPGDGMPVVIDQRDETFQPAIAVVQAGSPVQFTNSDPTSHHVYSFSRPNAFALPLYKGDDTLTQVFSQPGVVVLGCNIHDSMLGYIVVVNSTRSGITGQDGRVTLADVPAGTHVVRAWAPGLDRTSPPEVGQVEVTPSAPATLAFRLDVAGVVPAVKRAGALAAGDY